MQILWIDYVEDEPASDLWDRIKTAHLPRMFKTASLGSANKFLVSSLLSFTPAMPSRR